MQTKAVLQRLFVGFSLVYPFPQLVAGPPLPRPLVAPRVAMAASLLAVHERIAQAAQARDAVALEHLMDPEVLVNDAGHRGIAAFERRWSPGKAESPFWSVLRRALTLGGAGAPGDAGRFVYPYPAALWPADVPVDSHVAIVADRVPLRVAGAANAAVRVYVGREILRIAGAHESVASGWIKLRTPGHVYGFVAAADTWSPSELRIVVTRAPFGEGWRIAEVSTRWPVNTDRAPFVIPGWSSGR